MNRTTTNTYLKFDENGVQRLVSIDSILNDGYPIDPENGDELDLVEDKLCDVWGDPV